MSLQNIYWREIFFHHPPIDIFWRLEMKRIRPFFFFLLIFAVNYGCAKIPSIQAEALQTPTSENSLQDISCKDTIQKLYSIEAYCPNNLTVLQQLFTKEFNEQYKPSLERCNQVKNYSIVKLLSPRDKDFPATIIENDNPNALVYYVEFETESTSGVTLDNNPSIVWIYMKADRIGQCKIDDISGGG